MTESSDTDVKITDFGLAKTELAIREDEDRCGTPAYIAVSCLPYMLYMSCTPY